jgi:alginate O-acetyltransferase complex protein AlgJ
LPGVAEVDATIQGVEVDPNPDFGEHGRGAVRALVDHGQLSIDGWVLGDRSAPRSVEIVEGDSHKVADAVMGQPRPDVTEAFPDASGTATCGFRALLRPPLAGAGPVRFRVVFENGERSELATLRCTVQESASTGGDAGWAAISDAERESEMVLHGTDGWLFLQRDRNDVLGQHTGSVRLSPDQKAQWRRALEARVEVSEQLGVLWSCLVAPDKESVYPEHLPAEVEPVERRPVHEFLEIAEEAGAPVAYALEWLEQAKAGPELYAKTDTHWNYRGSYVAYRAICDLLSRQGLDLEVVEEERLHWRDEELEGDLGGKVLGEPALGAMANVEVADPQARLTFDSGVINHGWVVRFEKPAEGRTCVLFGESFAYFLLPYFKETFERLVFVHTSMFIPEIVERERADVVLSLPLERFLIRPPDDENAFAKLRETVARKGAQLPWSPGTAAPSQ